ncbi:MAG: glycosyltransferase family 2 protein [Armatimonadota bacterium]|nr:glycosyltransferase family 2 protein [Armatimonadota bacterium]
MSSSSISVVVSTVDGRNSLEVCLGSIAGNSVPPLEVLVMHQGSDGGTAEAARKVARATSVEFNYIRLRTTGLTKSRNAAISAARGDTMAFTDDDCIAGADWLKALSRGLADPRVSCVCGRTEPANQTHRPRSTLLSTFKVERRQLIRGRHNPVTIGRGNNMAFRRQVLLDLGGFNEQIGCGATMEAGDDMDMFCRLLDSGGAILHAPDALVLHAQPNDWANALMKKRGYALSTSAILADRAVRGDLYAGALLLGKFAYEFIYLLCGGAARMNPRVAAVGWHSLVGAVSGLGYLRYRPFREESRRLAALARSRGRGP